MTREEKDRLIELMVKRAEEAQRRHDEKVARGEEIVYYEPAPGEYGLMNCMPLPWEDPNAAVGGTPLHPQVQR
jgi:hypothetical protein